MKKLLVLLCMASILNSACNSDDHLINPPKWLIGYWINVNIEGIQKGLTVTKDDIFLTDAPGKSISLNDHVNSKNPPEFELVDKSNKKYVIRVHGDLFVFEYISDKKINYDDKTYHRIVPE